MAEGAFPCLVDSTWERQESGRDGERSYYYYCCCSYPSHRRFSSKAERGRWIGLGSSYTAEGISTKKPPGSDPPPLPFGYCSGSQGGQLSPFTSSLPPSIKLWLFKKQQSLPALRRNLPVCWRSERSAWIPRSSSGLPATFSRGKAR